MICIVEKKKLEDGWVARKQEVEKQHQRRSDQRNRKVSKLKFFCVRNMHTEGKKFARTDKFFLGEFIFSRVKYVLTISK